MDQRGEAGILGLLVDVLLKPQQQEEVTNILLQCLQRSDTGRISAQAVLQGTAALYCYSSRMSG